MPDSKQIHAQKIGDRAGTGRALGNLGNLCEAQGQFDQAIAYYQQDLSIAREIGDHRGMAQILNNLATAYAKQQRFDRAQPYAEQHLALVKSLGDRPHEQLAHTHLGNIHAHRNMRLFAIEFSRIFFSQHNSAAAIDCLQQVVAISQQIGDHFETAKAWVNLGKALERNDQRVKAIAAFQQAQKGFAITDHPDLVERCEVVLKTLAESPKKPCIEP